MDVASCNTPPPCQDNTMFVPARVIDKPGSTTVKVTTALVRVEPGA